MRPKIAAFGCPQRSKHGRIPVARPLGNAALSHRYSAPAGATANRPDHLAAAAAS